MDHNFKDQSVRETVSEFEKRCGGSVSLHIEMIGQNRKFSVNLMSYRNSFIGHGLSEDLDDAIKRAIACGDFNIRGGKPNLSRNLRTELIAAQEEIEKLKKQRSYLLNKLCRGSAK